MDHIAEIEARWFGSSVDYEARRVRVLDDIRYLLDRAKAASPNLEEERAEAFKRGYQAAQQADTRRGNEQRSHDTYARISAESGELQGEVAESDDA